MRNQEQQRAKSALQSIFLRIQSTSSKRGSADAEDDSSGSEAASESGALVSDFDAYWKSLHSTAAAEALATASAKFDLTVFAEALVDVEELRRLKLPNVWDIISKYPLIVQPVSRIISCLPARRYPLNVYSPTESSYRYFVKTESEWAMN